MKLAFKNKFYGYSEKEVDIVLNIGTLEAVCTSLDIEFYQITDKITDFEFTSELIYQGYITACQLKYQKPKYNLLHAILWNEHMSKEAQKEFITKMQDLFGRITKMAEVPDIKKKMKK